jgi:hypothetical protein
MELETKALGAISLIDTVLKAALVKLKTLPAIIRQ